MVMSSKTMNWQKSLIMASSGWNGSITRGHGRSSLVELASVGAAQLSTPALAGLVVEKGAVHDAQTSLCSDRGGTVGRTVTRVADAVHRREFDWSMPAQANTDSELRLRVVLVMVTGVPRSTDDEDEDDEDDGDDGDDDVVVLSGVIVVGVTKGGDASGELLACTVEDVNELRPCVSPHTASVQELVVLMTLEEAELDTVRMDDVLDSIEKVVDVMPCVSAQMASVQLLVIIVAFGENIDAVILEGRSSSGINGN